MDTEILRKIGLEEKEIKVYLTLLRKGSITASIISKETDIDRATCYRYIDSLINKGLVSQVIQNNIKYFEAAHPDKILKDLKEKETEYEKLLPELIDISKTPKEEINVEVYKGKEGIKTALRTLIRNKTDHLVLGDEGYFQEIMPIFFEQFILECEQNKIREKVLCSEHVKKKIKGYDYKYSKTKALPNKEIFPTTTIIYDKGLILFNWKLPYNAVVISNKDMAEAYKSYFDILWKTAK